MATTLQLIVSDNGEKIVSKRFVFTTFTAKDGRKYRAVKLPHLTNRDGSPSKNAYVTFEDSDLTVSGASMLFLNEGKRKPNKPSKLSKRRTDDVDDDADDTIDDDDAADTGISNRIKRLEKLIARLAR